MLARRTVSTCTPEIAHKFGKYEEIECADIICTFFSAQMEQFSSILDAHQIWRLMKNVDFVISAIRFLVVLWKSQLLLDRLKEKRWIQF